MKVSFTLVLMFLLCSAHGLTAQIFFFNGTKYAGEPDSSGKHNFQDTKMKVHFDIGKQELLLISGESDEVLSEGSVQKDIEITRKADYTNYLFTYDLLSFANLTDYKDPSKEDDLKFFEMGTEVLHIKGQFYIVYLTKK